MTGTVSSSGRTAAPRAWWDEFQCYVLDRTVGAVCGFLATGGPSGFERWKAARSCVPPGLLTGPRSLSYPCHECRRWNEFTARPADVIIKPVDKVHARFPAPSVCNCLVRASVVS